VLIKSYGTKGHIKSNKVITPMLQGGAQFSDALPAILIPYRPFDENSIVADATDNTLHKSETIFLVFR
jgi:hypothetical protein